MIHIYIQCISILAAGLRCSVYAVAASASQSTLLLVPGPPWQLLVLKPIHTHTSAQTHAHPHTIKASGTQP